MYEVDDGVVQFDLPESTGGRTTSPTWSTDGSNAVSIVSIPDFAAFSFVQDGSLPPFQYWHIDPVRSKTTTMSAGRSAHGPHAVDTTRIGMESTPNRRRKNVLTFALSSTTTALSGAQPGSEATHFSDTVSVMPVMPLFWMGFFAPGAEPYCVAVPTAPPRSGSCDAPASEAASAELCSVRCE